MYRRSTLGDMKKFHVVSFLYGAAVMLGFSTLRGSDPSHHVYELRLYHVSEGKMDALKARFGGFSEPVYLHFGAFPPSRCRKQLGRLPGRSGMEEGKGRIRGERATG